MVSLAVLLLMMSAVALTIVLLAGRSETGPTTTPAEPDRAVVVSGSYGAGHDAAAARIVVELERAGWRTEVVDIVDMYPWGAGRALRRAYFTQLTVCPESWGWLLGALGGDRPAGRALTNAVRRALAVLAARRLRVATGRPGLVVSTHPFASAALGRLRRRGVLGCEAITYLTDPSVHALWVHPGVDRHLAIYSTAADQARALGARVDVIRPLTPEPVVVRRPREQVRAGLGLADRPLILVVGGSEGVGDLVESARDILTTGLGTPVVVCGHNGDLRSRVGELGGAVALGWQDGLGDLLAAADCVVQNAGGFTVLEAIAAGTPVVSYRCLPGHGSQNAAALAREGLAEWPRTVPALVDAITDALVERPHDTPWTSWQTLLDVVGAPQHAGANDLVAA